MKPEEVLHYFKKISEERLTKSEIKVGDLAVTVKFKSSNIEIQLLPCIKTTTGFRIVDIETKNWSKVIKPDKFAQTLSEVNKSNNRWR